MFTGRVPDLTRKLDQHQEKLEEYLNDFDKSIPLISLELAKVEVVLKSLSKKLDRQSRKSVVQLLKNIRDYNPRMKNRNRLWQIYIDLNKIIDELADLQEDLKWER